MNTKVFLLILAALGACVVSPEFLALVREFGVAVFWVALFWFIFWVL